MKTVWVFRRFAQIYVVISVVLTMLIGTVSTPSTDDRETFYSGSYIDILAADLTEDFSGVLPARRPAVTVSCKSLRNPTGSYRRVLLPGQELTASITCITSGSVR